MKPPLEKAIQDQIVDYLTASSIPFSVTDASRTWTKSGVFTHSKKGVKVGWPDITAILICGHDNRGNGWSTAFNGRFLGIEVKRPGQKPTVLQDSVHAHIRKHGGFVWIIHSLKELVDNLNTVGYDA